MLKQDVPLRTGWFGYRKLDVENCIAHIRAAYAAELRLARQTQQGMEETMAQLRQENKALRQRFAQQAAAQAAASVRAEGSDKLQQLTRKLEAAHAEIRRYQTRLFACERQMIALRRENADLEAACEQAREELQMAVARAASCAAKLRRQKSVCGEVRVFIYTNPFKENLPQYYESRIVKLSVSTDSTLELVKTAADILRSIYRSGYAYKRAGVILSDISPKRGIQRDLFDPTDRSKHERLMAAMDKINAAYGRHKVITAAEGFEPFKMNRQYLSRQFTTDWDQIIRVKAK